MNEDRNQVVAALDIGSTKVVMAVATCVHGEADVIAIGKVESGGVRQGQIINMDETKEAIVKAKEEAERISGVKLSQVYLSVGGHGVRTIASRGMIPIGNREINRTDMDRVLDVAKVIHIPEKSRILHALPRSFTVDDQEGIECPLSMKGIRLEVDAQLITISEKSLSNTLTCVEKAGLEVRKVILDQYASSRSTLEEDEKQVGVVLIEMGGGTCELIVYRDSCVNHLGSIPVGGLNFTQDLAIGLKTSMIRAETIKQKYGTALVDMVGEDENIEVIGLGERKARQVSRIEMSRILEARAEETLSLVFNQLTQWDVIKNLGAGIVITGGGSLLQGLIELAEFTFDVPVRRGGLRNGIAMQETYNSPTFATAVGTLLLACEQEWTPDFKKEGTSVVRNKTSRTWNQIKQFMNRALSI